MYFRQAGNKAIARSANQEAVGCFEQALDALQHLPESHDTVAHGIDVRIDLRNALLPLGDYGQIFETLREAETLAEALDDPYRLGLIHAYMTHYFWIMKNWDRAFAYGQRALALTEPLGDLRLHAYANFCLAEVHYSLGNYGQAIAAFEQNVARLTGDLPHDHIFGPAVLSVVCRRWLVQALAEIGAFAEGIARGEEALRIAELADHPYSLVSACSGCGYLYVCKGDVQKAIPLLDRSLELCRVWDIRQIVAGRALALGHALALAGQVSEALALLEQSAETADPTRLIGRHCQPGPVALKLR
jgi:tetratricopeptide (TPR) repeat protein